MLIVLCLCAYLLGSISFAVLLSKRFKTADPRKRGSGNPGASNMLRLAGKRLAFFTFIGDLGKGLFPVLLASQLGYNQQEQSWVGFSAVLGHLYPVFHGFNGGKGVSTTVGMLLGLYLPAALLALSVWLIVFYISRTSSLAALSALPTTLPLLAWQHVGILLPLCLLTLLVFWRHRRNLHDLFAGTERTF